VGERELENQRKRAEKRNNQTNMSASGTYLGKGENTSKGENKKMEHFLWILRGRDGGLEKSKRKN